jgi:hypothetical protein
MLIRSFEPLMRAYEAALAAEAVIAALIVALPMKALRPIPLFMVPSLNHCRVAGPFYEHSPANPIDDLRLTNRDEPDNHPLRLLLSAGFQNFLA